MSHRKLETFLHNLFLVVGPIAISIFIGILLYVFIFWKRI